MEKNPIYVISIGEIEQTILDFLSRRIELRFNCPSIILESIEKPHYAFDNKRNQFFSSRILKELIHIIPLDALKILGITWVDLYIPVLTFVFGQAQLGGKAALISLHRLSPKYYGSTANNSLLLERAAKEIVHELGHTFRLTHCRDKMCVMHFSASIRNIDVKGDIFCDSCLKILESRKKK
ncbi:archaemetzincin family Zn-dependent metalloprotease [candidate division KSB1 bacterium]|nr:archaemetzincin family Zn-dependent metalloprotease [candidate division KSB1 bacterium]